MIKTIQTTQVTFNAPFSLKEKTLRKARQEGITLKALLTLAMKEYLSDNLKITLDPTTDSYYDDVFADDDIVQKANALGEILTYKKL